jgi:glycine cleavage system protein P-like pyridoxal-binding family
MLGAEGITDAKYAILNANYMKAFRRTLSHFISGEQEEQLTK